MLWSGRRIKVAYFYTKWLLFIIVQLICGAKPRGTTDQLRSVYTTTESEKNIEAVKMGDIT